MKRKHMKIIVTLLIPASLLLAGCAAGQAPDIEPVTPPVTATVPLTVESAAVNAEATTRASTPLTSGSIGVFRLAGNGYEAINNRQYDYGTPAWVPNGGAGNAIYLGGETTQVCAYHPWQASLNNAAAIPLISQVLTADKDISYATSRDVDGSTANRSTTFNMIRAYAKVTFKFQRQNYPGRGEVQKVELKNLLPSATLNITSGVYSATDGVTGSSLLQTKSGLLIPDEGSIAWGSDFLLVPCIPPGAGMTIVITMDGKTMTTTVPLASYKPERGKYVTIMITVQGTSINATSVTTEEWINSGIGPVIPIP